MLYITGLPYGITVNTTFPSSNATIKYGTEEGNYTLTSSPTYTEVGTYNIYYKITANNFNDLEGTQTLTINAIDINVPTFTLNTDEIIYDGTAKMPEFTLKNGDYILEEETDYTVEYNDNINVGTSKIIITGKGHYKGTLEKTFTITPQGLSFAQEVLVENVVYNGEAQEPKVEVKDTKGTTLTLNEDYTVEYSNNTNAGTGTVIITGKGNYTGTVTKQFTIEKDNIKIEVSDNEVTYDGKQHGIKINIITDLEEAVIKYGTTEEQCNLDDMPTYTNAGTYTIYYEISANNYNTFKGSTNMIINEKSINSAILTLDDEKYTYSGVAKTPIVKVKDEDTTLTENTDYTVTYSDNVNAGTGIITITGKGNYKETASITFEIEKGTPMYTVPSGLITSYGSTLGKVTLPSGFSWEDDLNTEVGEIGLNTFKCTYTPEDTDNYNNVTEIEVTLKVMEKLTVNIEEYATQISEDENTIYINDINENTPLEEIKNKITSNGTITIYESDGTEITNNNENIKTGMKIEIKTLAETVDYILIVPGDNNGDGKFNAVDLLRLARHLADIDKNIKGEYLTACNVHKDAKVNEADLLKMARVMSGQDSFK